MKVLAEYLRNASPLRILRPAGWKSAAPPSELECLREARKAAIPEATHHVDDPTAWIRSVTDPRDVYLA